MLIGGTSVKLKVKRRKSSTKIEEMQKFDGTLFAVTVLALALSAQAVPLRTRQNAKFLREPFARTQTLPYAPAGQRPAVPFDLPTNVRGPQTPTEQQSKTAKPSLEPAVEGVIEEEETEDLPEDIDPIAADAAEDDEAPPPAKEEDEEDENADILPEQKPGGTPSRRFWFFK